MDFPTRTTFGAPCIEPQSSYTTEFGAELTTLLLRTRRVSNLPLIPELSIQIRTLQPYRSRPNNPSSQRNYTDNFLRPTSKGTQDGSPSKDTSIYRNYYKRRKYNSPPDRGRVIFRPRHCPEGTLWHSRKLGVRSPDRASCLRTARLGRCSRDRRPSS